MGEGFLALGGGAGMLGHAWLSHNPVRPQGTVTSWLQRTSQAEQPEPTAVLLRALQGTDSEHRAQPRRVGDLRVEAGTMGSHLLVL